MSRKRFAPDFQYLRHRHGVRNPICMLIAPVATALAAGWLALAAGSALAVEPFAPVRTDLIRGGEPAQTVEAVLDGAQDLWLVVHFGPDDYNYDQAIWAAPTLSDQAGRTLDLATVAPESVTVGWGRLYVNRNHTGAPLRIGDQQFDAGFWAHGPSALHFRLDGTWDRFTAQVGIDAGAGQNGSVVFEVTALAPDMPTEAEYKPPEPTPPLPLVALPADQSPSHFHREAADRLLEAGVEKLVFVRRFTLDADHIYTEFVNSRWMPGGGLCVLDLRTGEVRDLVPQLADGVVNRFDVSYDGRHIVFDYKASNDTGYRIYEVGADGSGLRQLTFPEPNEAQLVELYRLGYHHGTDDMHPCYLPDGGIVFSSTRVQNSILCDSSDNFTAMVLYRMDGDGANMRRLSANTVSEASPAVLPDGRIIYHRWEYNDKGAGAVKCLWSMRPDGGGSAEVYGNTITDPHTMIYPRPVPGAPHLVCFLGASHWGPNNAMGTVLMLDMRQDMRSPEAMTRITREVDARAHDGFHFLVDGEWRHDKTGRPGRLFKDPYPLSESLIIAARKPQGLAWDDPRGYGLCLLDAEGNDTPLFDDEAISCWLPYPLRSRPAPPVPLTPVDPRLAEANLAHCVVTDVYEGLDGVERGTIKYLRILEQTARPWSARTRWGGDREELAHSTLGYGVLGMKAQFGVVPVEADGSASFYVPADRNIYFQALDENYMAVQTERTYVNYIPGETRSCAGCHRRAERVPSPDENLHALALRRAPSQPGPQPGDDTGRILFDYERRIQPIWDRHCVSCHDDGPDAPAALDLTGRPTRLYSVSYENLVRNRHVGDGAVASPLVGLQVDENDVRAFVQLAEPRKFGSGSSVLAAVFVGSKPNFSWYEGQGRTDLRDRVETLRQAHEGVRLDRAEMARMVNWLDAGCQYYGSYWGRKNIQYRDEPGFRPEVTFAEALDVVPPSSLADLYPEALRPGGE